MTLTAYRDETRAGQRAAPAGRLSPGEWAELTGERGSYSTVKVQ